ncbi:hypothetical protein N7456_009037 [Penicillium angulare]|uniref:Zn(2)-C6 fungal-type domain-containing protein n=1 Tax=Penicillium angulare TaxID=116970 RepID=A0A9W9F479_9EURO|nr:hypothetical protein N7456_009037 [Penicillium angulare]
MSRLIRPRLACQPCTKKKIKCDKLVPCDNCIKRGHPNICSRSSGENGNLDSISQQEITGRVEPVSATLDGAAERMMELMQSLVKRIEHIEERQHRPEEGRVDLNIPALSHNESHTIGDIGQRPNNISTSLTNTTTAIRGSLSSLRSILDEEHDFNQIEDRQREFLQQFVPDESCATQLVQYHTESLLWSHGGYHAPTLKQEVDRFFSAQNGQITSATEGLQWLSLLFAIISGSIISASAILAEKWGFQKEEQSLLSKRWHDAALECLHSSRYLSNHSLYTLQAIVVLNTSAYMLGYMQSQNVLNATGIRIAQNMGMHRMGSETEGLSEGLIHRETCRRTWYALVRQDYFFIPFSDSYGVRPVFNKTTPPRNCRDEEMAPLPEYMPTITSYCLFLDRIAGLMPELHDAFNACSTVYARYEEVIKFDSKMRALATVHRPYFFTDSPIDPAWPNYIPWARCGLTISFAHKVIMIHRKMLAKSMTDPIFSFTRKTCVAASKTILKTLRQPHIEQRPIMWTEQAFTVTAGVILCFDMLYRSPLDSDSPQQQHRALVEEGVDNLRQIRQSSIAQKGVRLLTALLRENTGRNAATRNKRCFDEMEAGITSRESLAPFIDVETFIQGFWKRKGDKDGQAMGPTAPSPITATGEVSPFGSEDVGWAADYGLYWPFTSTMVGEGISDNFDSRGMYWPLPSLAQAENSVNAFDARGESNEKIPSFEDLLFRAENFDF